MSQRYDEQAALLADREAREFIKDLNGIADTDERWKKMTARLQEIAGRFAKGDTKALYLYGRFILAAWNQVRVLRKTDEGRKYAREFMSLLSQHIAAAGTAFFRSRGQLYFGGQVNDEDNHDVLYNMVYISEVVSAVVATYPGL